MEATSLRAWWWHRQGLDGSLAGRTAVDAAVAALDIHELPGARGCTYVVPAKDFGLALTAGQGFGGGEMSVARKLGVTDKEVDTLCDKVVAVLAKGPLDPEALKAAAGPAVKQLGEEGKKKGLTSTLPVALGRLQQAGQIRRMPTNGRLDQQRYKYALVASIDSISLLRRDLPSLLGAADLKRSVMGERGARALGGLADLPSHAILDRGRLVGLWEFDPETHKIVWWAFGADPRDRALLEGIERAEAFVASDLGDARAFSLDSAKSRAPRIAALRGAAAR